MSFATSRERLKAEKKKIEEELMRLKPEKTGIQEKLSSILNEEERLIKELRECRDAYKYNKIDVRLNMISRSRREINSENEGLERRVRGLTEDLEKITRKIQYLKPK